MQLAKEKLVAAADEEFVKELKQKQTQPKTTRAPWTQSPMHLHPPENLEKRRKSVVHVRALLILVLDSIYPL
jgi:hypothetical protein